MDNIFSHLSPTNFQTPILGPIRRFNQETFGTPNYANPELSPEEQAQALVMAFGTKGVGGTRVEPTQLARAVKLMRGKLTSEDINTFGKFGQLVETGRGRGNLGQVGQDVQSFVSNVFGGKAGREWTNKDVKQALDLLLSRLLPGNY